MTIMRTNLTPSNAAIDPLLREVATFEGSMLRYPTMHHQPGAMVIVGGGGGYPGKA